jgi:hypothetical protein
MGRQWRCPILPYPGQLGSRPREAVVRGNGGCFVCPRQGPTPLPCGREINRRISFIENVRDDQVYGLFPKFQGFLDRTEIRRFAARLRQFHADLATEFIARVPREWDVAKEARAAWAAMITQRAQFLSETIEMRLWPQQQFNDGGTA